MNLPTIHISQASFAALPVSESSANDQPACRWQSRHGQWIYINRADKDIPCAVIEISDMTPSGMVVSQTFATDEEALAHAKMMFSTSGGGKPERNPEIRGPKRHRQPTNGAFGKSKRR